MNNNKKNAVIITGSAGGIGQALCEKFNDEGFVTIGIDKTVETHSFTDHFYQFDLVTLANDKQARLQLANQIARVTKESPLQALINNAAIQIPGSLAELEIDSFTQTMNVNVTAPLVMAQLFLPQLKNQKGSIINIGSIHRRLTKPGFISYATSKSAMAGLTRSLAVDLGTAGVRVNCIEPAATETDMLKAGFASRPEKMQELKTMHPLQRIAGPAEIAKLAYFLVTEDASFISGATLSIDGAIGVRLHDPV